MVMHIRRAGKNVTVRLPKNITVPDDMLKGQAELVGRVAIRWNSAHYAVFLLFETITGMTAAWEVFWALKADTAQRDITLSAAVPLLKDQPDILRRLKESFNKLGALAGERNAIIHAAWSVVLKPPNHEARTIEVDRFVPIKQYPKLEDDLYKQAKRLHGDLALLEEELIKIDYEIQRLLASSDTDPRRLNLPAPNHRADDPPGRPASTSLPPEPSRE